MTRERKGENITLDVKDAILGSKVRCIESNENVDEILKSIKEQIVLADILAMIDLELSWRKDK